MKIPSQSKDPGFMEIIEELGKSTRNERSLVLIACGYIELLAGVLVGEKCKNKKEINDDKRTYSLAVKLLLLNEVGAIDDALYASLFRFRKLRNRAAHHAIFSITDADKKHFLRVKGSEETSLGEHSVCLLFYFWKSGQDTFNRHFYPGSIKPTIAPK